MNEVRNKYICPVCHSDKFDYVSYSGEVWGGIYQVEEHSSCPSCGLVVEMAYSPKIAAFRDVKKGFRSPNGEYYPKDVRRHKRHRRHSYGRDKGHEVNPYWVWMV